MQMYKGLPIITNKIFEVEKQDIPHHILDQIGLQEQPWTVANFRREALKAIREIRSRDRLPILVGGTHYYTEAVLFDDHLLDDACSGREEYSRERFPILDAPTSEILEKLRGVDPQTASKWHPCDRRKIQRSLEIWLQTGKTASQIYEEQSQRRLSLRASDPIASGDHATAYSSLIFWLRADDEVLKSRLDNRVEKMLVAGLIEEAQAIAQSERELAAAGTVIDRARGIWASIGYKEMEPYLLALGDESKTRAELEAIKASCIEATKCATRRYARRQERWIRNHFSKALIESGTMDTLYPLDCTSLDGWDVNVHTPVLDITQSFLVGDRRPAPESLSDMAKKTISGIQAELENENTRKCRYCEVCKRTLMTKKQWTAHLAGNPHRRALAWKKRREAFKGWQAHQTAAGGEGELPTTLLT